MEIFMFFYAPAGKFVFSSLIKPPTELLLSQDKGCKPPRLKEGARFQNNVATLVFFLFLLDFSFSFPFFFLFFSFNFLIFYKFTFLKFFFLFFLFFYFFFISIFSPFFYFFPFFLSNNFSDFFVNLISSLYFLLFSTFLTPSLSIGTRQDDQNYDNSDEKPPKIMKKINELMNNQVKLKTLKEQLILHA